MLEQLLRYKRSQRGKPLLCLGIDTFCAQRVSGLKTVWACTKKSLNCPAVVVTYDVFYKKSQRGKMLLCIGKYSFSVQKVNGLKKRWICSTHSTKKCHAKVFTYDGTIIKINNDHSH
ncbi:Uncharacterized protein OBRU01_24343 [Operophtera brumata]|uniref:FLYWCH-type domain-containing protein n=1 Tax=Operophtera brumata TaxID=104452 RepID=A0A0L7KMP3_OPEBR|nr:Uncharacterized protein OBRU01_24343 [Operophtera brumata]